jgi:hypothetical protein
MQGLLKPEAEFRNRASRNLAYGKLRLVGLRASLVGLFLHCHIRVLEKDLRSEDNGHFLRSMRRVDALRA